MSNAAIQSTVTFETIQDNLRDILAVTNLWIATPRYTTLIATYTVARKDEFLRNSEQEQVCWLLIVWRREHEHALTPPLSKTFLGGERLQTPFLYCEYE